MAEVVRAGDAVLQYSKAESAQIMALLCLRAGMKRLAVG